MVVGATGEDDDLIGGNSMPKAGAAYIFENQNGTWVEIQKIIASDRSASDEFGWSVDIDGNTIVVGAHKDFEDENGLNPIHHAGSVYIFENQAGIWNETQKIVAGDRALDLVYPTGHVGEDLSDQFGHTIGISGSYIVVGALNHDFRPDLTSAWQCGSAYIFEKSGGTWTQVQQIINSDNASSGGWERFGSSVAIDSNIIAVGMWAQDYSITGTDYMKNAGAVYTFVRDGSGDWNENQKIVAGNRNTGDHFGWDVKINDGYIIAGVEHDDHDENETNALLEAGSAYIFEKNSTGQFIELNKIRGSDRDSLDIFGYAVDVYGTEAIVGAFQHDFNVIHADSVDEAGAAYIFSSNPCPTQYYTNTIEICNGATYTVGSSTYSTSGNYTDVLTSVLTGCDSSITTNLTVISDIITTQNITICQGENYVVGTSTYTLTGNYSDVLSAVISGCDSTVNTNLTVIQQVITNQNITICNGESLSIGASTYNTTGNYTDNLISLLTGCDSVVNTNLTVLAPITLTQNIIICDGDTYSIGASNYTTSGSYSDVLIANNTCDSTVTTLLTVIPPINVNQTISICDGDSYQIGTSTYTTAGNYIDLLTSINGCDSTVNTEIVIITEFVISQNITVCYGESYTIGNHTYTTPGDYSDTLAMTTSSCDSIVLTNLMINLPIDVSLEIDNNNIESNQNNSFYQWVDCDNNYSYITTTVSNNQDIDVVESGNYAVIINNNNCIDTSACAYVDFVGLKDYSKHNIKIYPNPSNGEFTISNSFNEIYGMKIINSVGQTVFIKMNISNSNYSIENLNLAIGVYFVEVSLEKEVLIKKLIVD